MSDFQRFLKNLPQAPIEERIQIFRHEALRPLHMAKGYAALLKAEGQKWSELSPEVEQLSQELLSYLDEMQQLLDALVEQPSEIDPQ